MEIQTIRPAAVVDRNRTVLLTTTAATTILAHVPRLTGFYWIAPYVEVANATTALTLGVQWVDPISGNTAQFGWLNATPTAVGVYLPAPRAFLAQAGQPIVLSATAGTANNVSVGAVLVHLP
jgi:hypothetical protein